MIEVLDPQDPMSALDRDAVYDRANELLHSTTLQSELQGGNVDDVVATAAQEEQRLSTSDLRAFILTNMLSVYYLKAVMNDGLGRSEFHIAGEACRVGSVVRSLLDITDVPELSSVTKLSHQKGAEEEFWIPDGVAYPCPTIDGHDEYEPRMILTTSHQVVYAPSMHAVWLQTLRKQIFPELEHGYLSLLEPSSFRLTNGGVVADANPRYYRLTTEPTPAVPIKPRELVSA